MIFRTNKQHEEELEMIYDDGFSIGLNMGYIAAETRIKNYIAQLDDMDWLLAELDQIDGPEDTEDCE